MPHYKCVACKTRLYSSAGPADPVGDLCPQCGSQLDPVAKLSEVVGFQLIAPRDARALSTGERLSDPIGALIAHREARRTRARRDTLRWVDDDGELRADALALPRPETYP